MLDQNQELATKEWLAGLGLPIVMHIFNLAAQRTTCSSVWNTGISRGFGKLIFFVRMTLI